MLNPIEENYHKQPQVLSEMEKVIRIESKLCSCQQKILIVDDNAFNLMPIKLLLKDMKIDFTLVDQIKKGKVQSSLGSNILNSNLFSHSLSKFSSKSNKGE